MTSVVQALLGVLPVAALLKISTDDAIGKGRWWPVVSSP
jgi:hypothetical protein